MTTYRCYVRSWASSSYPYSGDVRLETDGDPCLLEGDARSIVELLLSKERQEST